MFAGGGPCVGCPALPSKAFDLVSHRYVMFSHVLAELHLSCSSTTDAYTNALRLAHSGIKPSYKFWDPPFNSFRNIFRCALCALEVSDHVAREARFT